MLGYDSQFQPVVLLRVDGEDAPDLLSRASGVTFNISSVKLSEVKIDFHVFDPSPDFADTLLSDPRCQPDAQWSCRFGYLMDLAGPIHLRVTHFEPEFGEDGTCSLVMYLHSRGARAARDTQSRNWGNVTTSDIARQIAARYGFAVDIEDSNDRRSRGHMYTQPSTVSDLQFINSLAQRIHFVSYIEGNTLHYHRPRTETAPILELMWYAGQPSGIMRSFRPVVKETRADRARVQGEEAHGSESAGEASTDGGRETSHGGVLINLYSRSGSSVVLSDPMAVVATPTTEQDQRNRLRHAHARRRSMLERANKGQLECLGAPSLMPDKNVLIDGVSPQLSGIWHIEEVTHTISEDGTYTTSAQVKRGAHVARVRPTPTVDGRATPNADAANGTGRPNGILNVDVRARSGYAIVEQPVPEALVSE